MVYIVNELLGTMQFIFLFYVLFKNQMAFHKKKVSVLVIGYILTAFIMITLHQEENLIIEGTIFQIVTAWMFLEENIWGKLLSFLLVFSLPSMLAVSFEIILRFFIQGNVLDGFLDFEYGLGGQTLCLLAIMGVFTCRRVKSEQLYISNMTKFLLSFIIILFLVVLSWMTRNHGHVDSITTILMSCCSIMIVILCIWLMVIDSSRKINGYRLEAASQRYTYAKELERNQREIRKIHHDLNKHIQIISLYAREKRLDKIDEYVKELYRNVTTNYRDVEHTQNLLFNGILEDRIKKADEKNIIIKHQGNLKDTLPISDYDFCLIIMNLLDNALEYVEKQNLHDVNVLTYQDDQALMLKVINPLAMGEDIDIIKSSKIDKISHGFGISIVKQMVVRNRGGFEIETEGKQFVARVIINT